MMATVNQMMPLSGQPNRFSFHIETNEKATRITPRNTISRTNNLDTIAPRGFKTVSSGCTKKLLQPPATSRPARERQIKLSINVLAKRERAARPLPLNQTFRLAQLLGAWKELIMGEMVKLLQATNDPKILQLADENIALAQGATRLKFGVVAGGKK
jgi:hypothetical protein